jgi:DUF4097 and DUF4098 domain-containing protein YvlB
MGSADVTVASGNVMVQGATGDVRLVATSGDLDAIDVAGKTTLESTSGNARAMDVRGPVDARVTSGDLDLHLRTQASVTASVTSGDMTVTVPAGNYKVNVDDQNEDEDNGDPATSAGIVPDPTSKFALDLSAASGDLTLVAGPAA